MSDNNKAPAEEPKSARDVRILEMFTEAYESVIKRLEDGDVLDSFILAIATKKGTQVFGTGNPNMSYVFGTHMANDPMLAATIKAAVEGYEMIKDLNEDADPIAGLLSTLRTPGFESIATRLEDMSDDELGLHDCDNCEVKGDCPIENIVRTLKKIKVKLNKEE
jgi:hypothetical protein